VRLLPHRFVRDGSALRASEAQQLGLTAEPAEVRNVLITIDALDIPQVLPFWRAVLGHDTRKGGPVDATIAAGGHVVTDRYAPPWWVLADAEGNEAWAESVAGMAAHLREGPVDECGSLRTSTIGPWTSAGRRTRQPEERLGPQPVIEVPAARWSSVVTLGRR
jgi:hypothetical protein